MSWSDQLGDARGHFVRKTMMLRSSVRGTQVSQDKPDIGRMSGSVTKTLEFNLDHTRRQGWQYELYHAPLQTHTTGVCTDAVGSIQGVSCCQRARCH